MTIDNRLLAMAHLLVVVAPVLVLALLRGERRVLTIDLEREVGPADDRRRQRLLAITGFCTLAGLSAIFFANALTTMTAALLLCSLVPTGALIAELFAAVRSVPTPSARPRFFVPLTQPTLRDVVSLPLQLANLLVWLLACAGFAALLPTLPQRVALHFDVTGQADRFGSPQELWMLGAVMIFDWLLLVMISFTVTRERWVMPEQNPEIVARLQLERRRLLVRMLEVLMFGLNAVLALQWLGITLTLEDSKHLGVLLMVTVLLLGAAIVGPLLAFLPRLFAVQLELRRLCGEGVLGTRGEGWRAHGLIYFAPEDPAVFVPKLRGIGQTLNFARPSAWLFLAAVLSLPLLVPVLVSMLRH